MHCSGRRKMHHAYHGVLAVAVFQAAFAGNLIQMYDRRRIVQGARAGLRPPDSQDEGRRCVAALRAISGGLEAVATGPAPRQAAKSPVGASSGCPFDPKSSPPFQDRSGQAACCSSPILPLLAQSRRAPRRARLSLVGCARVSSIAASVTTMRPLCADVKASLIAAGHRATPRIALGRRALARGPRRWRLTGGRPWDG